MMDKTQYKAMYRITRRAAFKQTLKMPSFWARVLFILLGAAVAISLIFIGSISLRNAYSLNTNPILVAMSNQLLSNKTAFLTYLQDTQQSIGSLQFLASIMSGAIFFIFCLIMSSNMIFNTPLKEARTLSLACLFALQDEGYSDKEISEFEDATNPWQLRELPMD